MKHSRLLAAILNSPWAINPAYAEGFFPGVYSLLQGQTFPFELEHSAPELQISFHSLGASVPSAKTMTSGQTREQFVAIMPVKGPIMKYSQMCGPVGTEFLRKELARYEANPNIMGVVLDIDSGGGQVAGTADFADAIKSFSKPIVAHVSDTMASAALWIGAAADEIYASKNALSIGSVGVLLSALDMKGYYEKKGAKLHEVYSSYSNLKNGPFRKMMEGEYDQMRSEVLDPIAEQFIATIKEYRPNISDNEEIFQGKVFDAKTSKKLGIIDHIGTMDDAINRVTELADDQSTQTQASLKSGSGLKGQVTTPKAGPSKTPSKNQNTMWKAIAAILGVSALESTDEGTYLTEEQMNAIESELDREVVSQTDHQVVVDARDAAQGTVSEVETELRSILADEGVEGGESMSATELVAAAKTVIADYGKAAGGKHTGSKGNPDKPGAASWIDPNAEHNLAFREAQGEV